jgi:DNA-binding FrmR family transcriptional regulator
MDEVIAAHLQDHVADPDLTEAVRAQGAEELLTVIRRYSK